MTKITTKILVEDDKVNSITLHKKSEQVERISDVIPLIRALSTTLATLPNAAGVAAPQIGENKQVFVAHFGLDKKSVFPRKERRLFKVNGEVAMINPVLVKKLGVDFYNYEGCLSVPNKVFSVERNTRIEVSYTNINGQKVAAILANGDAATFLHEYDHLQGITLKNNPTAKEVSIPGKADEQKKTNEQK